MQTNTMQKSINILALTIFGILNSSSALANSTLSSLCEQAKVAMAALSAAQQDLNETGWRKIVNAQEQISEQLTYLDAHREGCADQSFNNEYYHESLDCSEQTVADGNATYASLLINKELVDGLAIKMDTFGNETLSGYASEIHYRLEKFCSTGV